MVSIIISIIVESRIQQCFAVNIAGSCQQYCSALSQNMSISIVMMWLSQKSTLSQSLKNMFNIHCLLQLAIVIHMSYVHAINRWDSSIQTIDSCTIALFSMPKGLLRPYLINSKSVSLLVQGKAIVKPTQLYICSINKFSLVLIL
jgi:hypothetical protein